MSSYYYAAIKIGGKVTITQGDSLLAALQADAVLPVTQERMPITPHGLAAMAAHAESKCLEFEDAKARAGCFEATEDLLYKERIPYMRYTAANIDVPEFRVIFTGEGEPREELLVSGTSICRYPQKHAMKEVLDLLKQGLIEQGIAMLERNIGPKTEDLPPFTIINNS